ncbi:hypothetical protein [Methylobacterium thuringiense]|uniref:Uncharacterized protein n=1 Tax=Methylobacterium thuringiense TaxID=1003091 RepID=A0ABQ4TSE3_9HYPH|nr:hypothetical protein [Methylobacterium thuringiense]GJE57319.1 hypothetical protein EKPJFOCH_3833 [Methylobacterium thuringiense]
MTAQNKRPTLDSLTSRFAKKEGAPAAAPASAPVAETKTAEASNPAQVGKKDDRVQILTRVDAPTRKKLRMIALEQDRTVQDICEEAIRDFVVRHSR